MQKIRFTINNLFLASTFHLLDRHMQRSQVQRDKIGSSSCLGEEPCWPTSPASGCAGPTQRCCRRCSRRSRPWSRGWWPGRSRRGPRMSALPWCAGLEQPGPKWTECWPPLPLLGCDHQGAIGRNECSYPCSTETKIIKKSLMRKGKQH